MQERLFIRSGVQVTQTSKSPPAAGAWISGVSIRNSSVAWYTRKVVRTKSGLSFGETATSQVRTSASGLGSAAKDTVFVSGPAWAVSQEAAGVRTYSKLVSNGMLMLSPRVPSRTGMTGSDGVTMRSRNEIILTAELPPQYADSRI